MQKTKYRAVVEITVEYESENDIRAECEALQHASYSVRQLGMIRRLERRNGAKCVAINSSRQHDST